MSKRSKALNEKNLSKASGGSVDYSRHIDTETGKETHTISYDNDKKSKIAAAGVTLDQFQGLAAPNYPALDDKPAWNNSSSDREMVD